MSVQKITIGQFLELAPRLSILDVRSPGEYLHAHIPGAYNLPLFTDEERKVVGAIYKQQSKEAAIKTGLDYFGVKMRKMVEEAESLMKSKQREDGLLPDNSVLVHCWRGGMRSAGVAWLLDLYGFKVYTLTGGYKVYRKWVRSQFEKPLNLMLLGGYTGSGKTLVLQELKRAGKHIIDLEELAKHKGSAFGGLGQPVQPSQEMFENLLAVELASFGGQAATFKETRAMFDHLENFVYIEDESQRIGLLNIPGYLWNTMQISPIQFIDIPFEERLRYLAEEYGEFAREDLINAVSRIRKRLGGQETNTAINHLMENNYKECFRVLLKYYDKWYEKAMLNRGNAATLNKITCASVDVKTITNKLINERATAE